MQHKLSVALYRLLNKTTTALRMDAHGLFEEISAIIDAMVASGIETGLLAMLWSSGQSRNS